MQTVQSLQEKYAVVVRRLLFAYTIMFAAGISAGFFVFERGRIAGGTVLMIVISVLMCMFENSESNRNDGKHIKIHYTCKMLAVISFGFIFFTCRYIHYEMIQASATDPQNDENSKSEELYGIAESAVMTEKGMRIIVLTDDNRNKVQVSCYGENHPAPAELIGRKILAYGYFREPQSADNPGCFDYRTYLRGRGIGCTFSARSISLNNGDGYISLRERYIRHLFLVREQFLDQFDDKDIRAFVKGMIFGDKTDIDNDIIEDFNNNGTGHVLAVSGLHTGFLYALLRMVTGKKRTGNAAAITIGLLLIYGEMTMWSPPTVRAVTVLSISMMSIYVKRPFDLLSSVSAAAFLLLLLEPYQLFSSSFQLSFAAMMGICFLCEPLSVFIGEFFAVPVSVQLGVAPLTAFLFHRFNALSVIINIPVIFIASVLVPLCMISLIFTAVTGQETGLLTAVIEGMSEILIKANCFASHGGYFSDLVNSCNAGIVIGFYMMSFLLVSEWCRVRFIRKSTRSVIIAVLCVLIISLDFVVLTFSPFSDDEIVFVSVGQGDCTHIRADGEDILIDGGGNTERNIGKDILMPYLLANGAERLEMALVTHLHTDHCLGILELQQEYPVGLIGIPSDYEKAVEQIRSSSVRTYDKKNEESDIINDLLAECSNIRMISPGSRLHISDDVYIDAVWPVRRQKTDHDIDDANENNMVFIVSYKGIKIMVTGDLLEEDELEMVKHYKGTDILKCDVLKVAHHGSKSSSSEEFLDTVNPAIAVIQVGKNNFYGHPHDQTLQRLQDRNIEIYRTDLNGAVGIDLGKSIIKVDVMRRYENHRTNFYS